VSNFNQANRLFSSGRYQEAADAYLAVVARSPGHADAWYNLGVTRTLQRRFSDAVDAYRRALVYHPAYPNAHNNLAILLHACGAREEARRHFRAAGTRESFYNVALTLQEEERFHEAEEAYRYLLERHPGHPEAHNNLGNTLLAQRRAPQAEAAYRRALALDPKNPEAHFNLGVARLLLGDLIEGFQQYEWRFRQPHTVQRDFARPLWDGSPLRGRRILLHAEQGLGDTIQFIRYAPMVKDRGGHVIAEVHKPLLALLPGIRGVDEWIGRGEALPPFDVHAPLLSLPRIFGTRLETIPARVPYLQVQRDLSEQWRAVLMRWPGFKVGLTWSGNPEHKNNHNRSLSPTDVDRLRLPGIQMFSLQKGAATTLPRLENETTTLADSAAILMHLDLLISVDTSMAHLAGALDRPVWTLLPFAPDWRWLLDRADSPWYPSMRLFRQDRPKDWNSVTERVARELMERIRAG
jgi:Flp pilus assembly protein TadD